MRERERGRGEKEASGRRVENQQTVRRVRKGYVNPTPASLEKKQSQL